MVITYPYVGLSFTAFSYPLVDSILVLHISSLRRLGVVGKSRSPDIGWQHLSTIWALASSSSGSARSKYGTGRQANCFTWVILLLIDLIALTNNHVMQDEDDCFSQGFYFIDDYRLAILRRSELCPWDDSLVIYDTREKADPVCEVPRLLLRLPNPGPECEAVGFYGPGEIPSDEDALFLTNQEQTLLAIEMDGFNDPESRPMHFIVITFRSLIAFASRGTEKPVEFEEWKHFTSEVEIPLELEWPSPAIGVCGPEILVFGSSPSLPQCRLWSYDFSPGARRTSFVSGQQQKYTLRKFNLRGGEMLSNSYQRWSILPQCLVLYQVSKPYLGSQSLLYFILTPSQEIPNSGKGVLRVWAP